MRFIARIFFLISISFLFACGETVVEYPSTEEPADPDMGLEEEDSTIHVPPERPRDPDPNDGWIGGPCEAANECQYEGATCLTQWPQGTCSQNCDRFCPDQDGKSVTFCIEQDGQGACVSRCDFLLYPDQGCRLGYQCRILPRFNEPGVEQAVCIPEGEPSPNATTECLRTLEERGIIWSPWNYTTQTSGGLTCDISDPIRVSSPINGVEWRYYNQSTSSPMSMSCELALALYDLGAVLQEFNITIGLHIGTFNCRAIAGTQRLSEHSFGRAIDIWGFADATGEEYILERDWELGNDNPTTQKGRALYDIAWRMHEDRIFNIVLTPEYNAAHHNHFHVDLRPDSNFIGSSLYPEYWIGSDRDECPGWD